MNPGNHVRVCRQVTILPLTSFPQFFLYEIPFLSHNQQRKNTEMVTKILRIISRQSPYLHHLYQYEQVAKKYTSLLHYYLVAIQKISQTIKFWVEKIWNESRNKADMIQTHSGEAVKQAAEHSRVMWPSDVNTARIPMMLVTAVRLYAANAAARYFCNRSTNRNTNKTPNSQINSTENYRRRYLTPLSQHHQYDLRKHFFLHAL